MQGVTVFGKPAVKSDLWTPAELIGARPSERPLQKMLDKATLLC